MARLFPFSPLRRWLHRDRLVLGPGTTVDPAARFRCDKGSRIETGAGCGIGHGVLMDAHKGRIVLGDRVSINAYSVLYGHGGLEIGDECRIATGCVFIPANHVFADREQPIRTQGQTAEGIRIGRDVWIGARVTVLDGAVVGDGCVIAAGAVVRGRLEPFGIYGGVPARRIGTRGEV